MYPSTRGRQVGSYPIYPKSTWFIEHVLNFKQAPVLKHASWPSAPHYLGWTLGKKILDILADVVCLGLPATCTILRLVLCILNLTSNYFLPHFKNAPRDWYNQCLIGFACKHVQQCVILIRTNVGITTCSRLKSSSTVVTILMHVGFNTAVELENVENCLLVLVPALLLSFLIFPFTVLIMLSLSYARIVVVVVAALAVAIVAACARSSTSSWLCDFPSLSSCPFSCFSFCFFFFLCFLFFFFSFCFFFFFFFFFFCFFLFFFFFCFLSSCFFLFFFVFFFLLFLLLLLLFLLFSMFLPFLLFLLLLFSSVFLFVFYFFFFFFLLFLLFLLFLFFFFFLFIFLFFLFLLFFSSFSYVASFSS